MAVVSDVQSVLDFLRKNGFKEAESALKQDVIEKVELGSFDFEKFLFPVVPLPPPVRILPNSRPLGFEDWANCDRSSSGNSDDEFLSLGSSEFTNPYGRRSVSRANSEASSDRLSQFGTARDYHDFDMQNDLYWFHDKEEGDFMTPCFGGSEPFGNPSEDKYVTTLETEKQYDNSSGFYHESEGLLVPSTNYLDKQCLYSVSPMDDINEAQINKYYHLDEKIVHGNGFEGKPESCSTPLCKCCGEGYDRDPVDYSNLSSSKTDLDDSRFNECVSAPVHIRNKITDNSIKSDSMANGIDITFELHKKITEKEFVPISNDSYEVGDGREVSGELSEHEAAATEDGNADELLMYKTQEDEYEVFDLRIVHRKNRTGFEENKDLPIMLNTVIAGRYYVTEYLGSAAFSKVFQAHDLHTGIDVCLKIIKNDKDFFDQSLDEIKLLKLVNKHDPGDEWHILRLYDFFYHQEHLFIVCELLRANLYEFLKFNQESGEEAYFTLPRLQVIARQCLEALNYMHHLGIIHCDLKPENILIRSYRRCEIKVIDLGSSCFLTDNLCLYVQSRSYRAPEVILGLPYDQKIDIWSLGCILAELCSGEVLFPNDAIVTILARMIAILGPIDMEMLVKGQETFKYFTKEYDLYHINEETNQMEYIIPEESSLEHHLQVSDVGFIDFLKNLLEINPQRRLTASEALNHPWLSHSY